MNRLYLSLAPLCVAIGLCLPGDAAAQVAFSESFGATNACTGGPPQPFPPGWFLRNVDNRSPSSQVAYVNQAWIVREDFGADVSNCVAFSTSFYSPAGAADDFMCTPQINVQANSRLRWRARNYDPAYRDGYEVRVMREVPTGGTGVIGNLISASTVVYSNSAEETAWQSREIDLHALGFGNEPLWVCFRNNSNDKFLLVIDDVQVRRDIHDAGVIDPERPSPYTRVYPTLGIPASRGVFVTNAGVFDLTNVVVTGEVRHDGLVVQSDAAPPTASLPVGAGADVTIAPTVPMSAPGFWTTRFQVTASETDLEPGNDMVESAAVFVGGDELARDGGPATGALGIGAGNGGELGQEFDLPLGGTVVAVRLGMSAHGVDSSWLGAPLVANLRAYDTVADEPGAIVASTVPVVVSTLEPLTYILNFAAPVTLAPGRYVLTAVEPIPPPGGSTTLAVLNNTSVFVPGTVWVNWPTIPTAGWANIEEFGPGFARTFHLSLLFDAAQFADGLEGDAPAMRPTDAAVRTRLPSSQRVPVASQRLIDATPQ